MCDLAKVYDLVPQARQDWLGNESRVHRRTRSELVSVHNNCRGPKDRRPCRIVIWRRGDCSVHQVRGFSQSWCQVLGLWSSHYCDRDSASIGRLKFVLVILPSFRPVLLVAFVVASFSYVSTSSRALLSRSRRYQLSNSGSYPCHLMRYSIFVSPFLVLLDRLLNNVSIS